MVKTGGAAIPVTVNITTVPGTAEGYVSVKHILYPIILFYLPCVKYFASQYFSLIEFRVIDKF